MAAVLTINGTTRSMMDGWSLRMAANARATLSCEIFSKAAAYRPTLDHVVTLTDNGTLVFGGFVSEAIERGAASDGHNTDITTTVTAVDYNSYTEHRHIDGTLTGGNLKSVLTQIIAILGTGITLHASQANGPTIPDLVYSDARLDGVLNDLTSLSGGWPWFIDENKALRMQDPTVLAAPFSILQGSTSKAVGDVEVIPSMDGYANTIIVKSANFRKFAIDGAEGAAHGAWEAIYTAPDDTDETSMQAMADDILARSTVQYKTVKYKTTTPGLKPGMAQTITLSKRNVNNTFLIMEVNLQHQDNTSASAALHYYHVTAIEGSVYQTDWRDTYRRWGGSAAGNVSGGIVIPGGGGGGSSTPTRVYSIGGNGSLAVQSPTPTWVPASGGSIGNGSVQAQINTVEIGTSSVTVKARLKALAAGVSVQARLYDATDSAACAGLSAVVTSQVWTNVTWSVTLTAGAHFYELQLLPGTANQGVLATGYVESA